MSPRFPLILSLSKDARWLRSPKMQVRRSAIAAALLAFVLAGLSCNAANAANDDVVLDGLSALSQLDPQNYRDIGLMRTTDTLPNSSRRTAVANLTCAAAVYVMIERGRGQASAMIDDFYIDPRLHGGRSPGARRPDYVSADLAIDPAVIESGLRAGQPVVLRGSGGPLGQHFVLAIGLVRDEAGGRYLIVLDPWPAPGEIMPKPDVRLDLASSPLRHPDIPGLVFAKMRRVSGAPFPLVPAEAAAETGTAEQAVGE
jgi:hypothetical protein